MCIYFFLDNGIVRYNCTIIELFARSVIASLNGDHITAELAIETVKLAIQLHKPKKGLIMHSAHGTQFTSHDFNAFCEKSHIQQSMSRAGCPYDNATMERYYNTLKSERMNHFSYKTKAELGSAVNEFAYYGTIMFVLIAIMVGKHLLRLELFYTLVL